MLRILVTGATGFVGSSMRLRGAVTHHLIGWFADDPYRHALA